MKIDIPRFETFARKVTRSILHHDGELGWSQNHCKSKKSQFIGFSYENKNTIGMKILIIPVLVMLPLQHYLTFSHSFW